MPSQFIRKSDVLKMTGLSHSTLYRKVNDGIFPPQFNLSENTVAWDKADIEEWMHLTKQGEWKRWH